VSDVLSGVVELEGLQMLPGGALFRPAREQLVIADVHLGKAASFRAQGIPVPEATTGENFARLDRLLSITAARQLVILGDLSHNALGRRKIRDPWLAWRGQHAALDVVLVPGNHDVEWPRRNRRQNPQRIPDARPSAIPDDAWPGLRVVDPIWLDQKLLMLHDAALLSDDRLSALRSARGSLNHQKSETSAKVLALCGHRHPVVRVPTLAGRHAIRRPCFFLDRRGCLHLPAFGSFTGGHPVDPQPDEEVFIDAVDRILVLPKGYEARAGDKGTGWSEIPAEESKGPKGRCSDAQRQQIR